MKALKIAGLVFALFGVAVIVVLACESAPGRMTGGGSVFINVPDFGSVEVKVDGGTDGTRVTHGFEIHCGYPDAYTIPEPNNLEINWKDEFGNSQQFHLEVLDYAQCFWNGDPKPPAAGFNTFIGKGLGRLNGEDGALIEFTFTDSGEPGVDDTELIHIWAANGDSELLVDPAKPVTYGNQQAHKYSKY